MKVSYKKLTFSQIEKTIGFSLPESARLYREFWANTTTHSIALSWLSVGYKTVEVIGLCTDICVVSNALIIKANFSETPITVDAACCAGVTPEKHEAALETMRNCQIDVR